LFGLFAYKRVVSGVGIGCECLDGLLGFLFVGLIVVNILGYIKLGLSILQEYCWG
jgi:hypothetical protein